MSPSWPSNLGQCHALLDAMAQQNRAMRQTLELAQECVTELQEASTCTVLAAEEEAEIKAFLKHQRRHNRKQSAELLMMENPLQREWERLKLSVPRLCDRQLALKTNEYDLKQAKKENTERWRARVDRIMHRQVVGILRGRDCHCLFTLSLARSFAIEHQHGPKGLVENLVREGFLHDANTLREIRAELTRWMPPVDFEFDDDLVMIALDNLDMYQKVTHTRLKNGATIKSQMIHALVMERILFRRDALQGPPPVGDLLIRDTAAVVQHAALPDRTTTEAFLNAEWVEFRAEVNEAESPMDVLAPPPAECDNQPGRTVCVSLPILTKSSTASKKDVTAALVELKKRYPSSKLIVVMDYQTFAVAWWIKARGGSLYDDIIPMGGELHRQFHTDDCCSIVLEVCLGTCCIMLVSE
eukprot:TRINITY_DN19698_c0_g1_i2.p1 TRINITY_DN19698_c0_g1~~TRINITY_DN19698_c0_g1_i2.p1  ORF type:complete len:413 (-),score=70.06 TRINITY_DN19698_c0_g1_i2:1524-2762(-)